MNDTDAANMIEMMLLGKTPRFTEQEISMMSTDMRTPAERYQDSRLELAMMNAGVGQKITKPRVSPQFAAEIADKVMRENYDPNPDVGSITGVAMNPISQAAGNVGFALQGFGDRAADAGPLGWMAGTAIKDLGEISQRAAYGESKATDPAMAILDILALTPGSYMSQGMRTAMSDKDVGPMIFRELLK